MGQKIKLSDIEVKGPAGGILQNTQKYLSNSVEKQKQILQRSSNSLGKYLIY